jgi:hypothetical protein
MALQKIYWSFRPNILMAAKKLKYWLNDICYYTNELDKLPVNTNPALAVAVTKDQA